MVVVVELVVGMVSGIITVVGVVVLEVVVVEVLLVIVMVVVVGILGVVYGGLRRCSLWRAPPLIL